MQTEEIRGINKKRSTNMYVTEFLLLKIKVHHRIIANIWTVQKL